MIKGKTRQLLRVLPSLNASKSANHVWASCHVRQYYGVLPFLHVSAHLCLVPPVAYDRMKRFLRRHHSLHFFFHQTYCRIVCAYISRSYSEFLRGLNNGS